VTVVEFHRPDPPPDEDEPEYQDGTARCLACKHAWRARAPVGTWQFECPACGCHKGVWAGFVDGAEGDSYWRCNCGGDIYRISPKGIFCIICGSWQRPYD
jgi:hypothetical protein